MGARFSIIALFVSAACTVHPGAPLTLSDGRSVRIPGLGPCDDAEAPVTLDRDAPVVVLVHGCSASAGRFRALARVFRFHGQQALCFTYDDRARLSRSAKQLGDAVSTLSKQVDDREVVVLGHSQGGLVARLALSGPDLHTDGNLRLVTVSAPFNGIRAARDCGATWLHVLSFGTTIAACRFATGAKWNQIHSRASLVTHPSPLSAHVEEHLRIYTDERDTCRTQRADGTCQQDDFVFSLAEQVNVRMVDGRARDVEVAAGHSEIVGNHEVEPRKLIGVLQKEHVMRETPLAQKPALQALLDRLF
jgi:pimeloyl-ACP methyl ester carboxylesterase